MATATPQRERVSRRYNGSVGTQNRYNGASTSAAVRVPDYPLTHPDYIPNRIPASRPAAKPQQTKQVQKQALSSVHNKKQIAKGILVFIGIFAMCCLMIYRYAMILETNDTIEKLNDTIGEAEAKNQALAAKIDRGLEIGALEEYATGELGMIRPDNAQVFYIDMQMESSSYNSEENGDGVVLQGTTGALVNAFRVLK